MNLKKLNEQIERVLNEISDETVDTVTNLRKEKFRTANTQLDIIANNTNNAETLKRAEDKETKARRDYYSHLHLKAKRKPVIDKLRDKEDLKKLYRDYENDKICTGEEILKDAQEIYLHLISEYTIEAELGDEDEAAFVEKLKAIGMPQTVQQAIDFYAKIMGATVEPYEED